MRRKFGQVGNSRKLIVGVLAGALAVWAAGGAAAKTLEEALSLAHAAIIQLLAVIGVFGKKRTMP